jgi:hypothetical protein
MYTSLKHVFPTMYLRENIAIVGSSSNLKDKEEGDFIDSFDEVVRFNRAPTKGWEKYVGSKTTVRVANNHVFGNVKHSVSGDEDCEDWKAGGQPQYFIKEQKRQRILLMNRDASAWEDFDIQVDVTCEAFLADYGKIEEFGKTRSPSVGYAFISLCVMNDLKTTLFGFGLNEDSQKASHYWENKDKIISSHGYKLERENIKKWQAQGKLQIK